MALAPRTLALRLLLLAVALATAPASAQVWHETREPGLDSLVRNGEPTRVPASPTEDILVPGDSLLPDERVANGEATRPVGSAGQAPTGTPVVEIVTRWPSGRTGGCTGSLIGARKVLTAGHCVCVSCPMSVQFGPGRRSSQPGPRTVVEVVERQMFRARPIYPGEDFAVLTLAPHTVDAAYRRTYPIVSTRTMLSQRLRRFIIIGYGKDERGDAGVKRYASVTARSLTCSQRVAIAAGCAPFREVILGAPQPDPVTGLGADSCEGDSGGPALALDASGEILGLAGVTSRAALGGEERCGRGGIYGLAGSVSTLEFLRRHVPDLRVL